MTDLRIELPSYRYPGAKTDALAALSLQFTEGSFSAIVGPSGTGKSTLLHLLAGLQTGRRAPSPGQITGLQGHSRQALMFQNPRLMPWLTVRENLQLVGDKSAAHLERCDALLAQTGLAERADDFPGALSGGMQRRVAMARAFCIAPQLLLMDEPFVSLDEPTADRLRAQLLELYQSARPTVILVTHNLHEALQLADRVIFLSPSPARVLLQHDLPATRPRSAATVAQIRATLLQQHPNLLHGELSTGVTS